MSNGRAFDSIGVLDMVVYTVLRTLGLYALPLRAVDGLTIGQVCEVNAATFLAHFDGTPIQAIKAVREASGFDLRSSKEAYEQVRDTYEDVNVDSVLPALALDAIRSGDSVRAASLLTMHLNR